jgi:hypothetical protein
LIVWRTDSDAVERGQWLHGRVYARRSDVSPDGRLMVYFAAKRSARDRLPDAGETWTAVSRPPYFTALAVFPKGDSWDGGGWFERNDRLHLNHGCRSDSLESLPKKFQVLADPGDGEDMPIYNKVLRAKGWTLLDDSGRMSGTQPHAWTKPAPDGVRLLRQDYEGWDNTKPGDPLRFAYSLCDPASGELLEILDSDWADFDQRGRLVEARDGKIFADGAEIADFNADRPESFAAPDRMTRWPR